MVVVSLGFLFNFFFCSIFFGFFFFGFQVVKNRYAGDLGIMPLEFHKDSLSFAPRKKTKLARRNEDDDAGVATPSSAAASKTTSSLR